MVTSQEIVERSFYISLLHQTLIRGLTINPENYLVKNEDGLWVPTRELNDQYIRDKEAIETELTKNGSGFYYIFGVGNNQSRGQKDLPRITLDLTAWYPGEIGLEKETNELDEASGLYQVIDYDYEPKSSRIDVHLCANNQQEMRILHEIMYRALPSRGYIKPYLNDYESWKTSKFSPSGNIYIEVGNFYDHDDLQQGFLEKVYTYEVRDSLLNPEIIAEIVPIADISVLIDSALTLHVPELPYDKQLISNVDSIKFVPKSRYSYLSHTEPEDYEVDLGSTINTGNKYVYYKETTIDPYIVPITITQNNQDVTDQCTFSFPTDKNISMAYEDGNLIFTVKSIISTQFDAEVVVTKGDQSISITFSVNFTIAIHGEIPNYVASDIFDVTKKLPLTLYGKAAGKDDILADGVKAPYLVIEQDAPWPLNFGTLTVKEPKPEPVYGEWLISNATYGRQGATLILNVSEEVEGSLNVHAEGSGGAFVLTDQLATDATFTSFTKGLQSNSYYALPSRHSRMHLTVIDPISTFVDNYDFSKVDHVDLALEICMASRNLSGLTINGINLLPYIVDQYGSDWASIVTWKSQTIKLYDYRTDISYNTHNVSMSNCCYLELTGLPIEIITNYKVAGKTTGISHSSGYDSALLYNFKLIKK